MGHDAFVRCNCQRDGKTKPYPFEFAFWFDEDHFLNVEGGFPRGKRWQQVKEYLQTACPHPNLNQAKEWLCTTQTMIQFKTFIHQLGCTQFPALCAYLPPATYDGSITSSQAEALLTDLDVLRTYPTIGQLALLIHSSTGQLAAKSGSVFAYYEADSEAYIVTEAGFLIAKPISFSPSMIIDPAKIVFSAQHFRREVTPQGAIRYQNIDTQAVYETSAPTWLIACYVNMPLWSVENGTAEFQLALKPIPVTYFAELIEALTTICQASMSTGNPVIWC